MDPSKLAGKAAGKAKSIGKALQGYTGIFRRLAEEHQEVAMMLKRVATSDDRRELFATIRKELLSHAKAEEKEFYTILRDQPETSALVEHSLEEHQEVERMLDELNTSDVASESWTRGIEELRASVEDHVKEEEQDLFPRARDVLGDDVAKNIEFNYDSTKKAEMARIR